MYLLNKRLFTFLIILIISTGVTYFIFYNFIKNVVAENITHSEYTSILIIGTVDIQPSNNSFIEQASSDDKNINDSDKEQLKITKSILVHLIHFNNLQRFIDHFPRLELLLHLCSHKSRSEG